MALALAWTGQVVVVVFGGSRCRCPACPPLREVGMVGCCIGVGLQGAARAVTTPSSSSSSLVALVAAVRPALVVSW
jgi:xanthosine utilization system XapX-like protein